MLFEVSVNLQLGRSRETAESAERDTPLRRWELLQLGRSRETAERGAASGRCRRLRPPSIRPQS